MKKEDLLGMDLTEDQAKKVMDSLDGNFVTKRYSMATATAYSAYTNIQNGNEYSFDMRAGATSARRIFGRLLLLSRKRKAVLFPRMLYGGKQKLFQDEKFALPYLNFLKIFSSS